ncbi:MAG: AI-2E family transporter [Acidimicrobiales bacterium]
MSQAADTGPPSAAPRSADSRWHIERIRRAGQVAWALAGMAAVLALVALVGWVVRVIWPPLILAAAIVFLLNPIVTRLQRRRVPRVLGTGITYVAVAGTVVLAGFLIAPQVSTQWDQLADEWPELRGDIEEWVDDQAERSRENDWPVEIPTSEELEDAIVGNDPATDVNGDGEVSADEEAAQDREELFDRIDTFREVGLRVFNVGLIFVIGPIIAFYLLIDLPHIRRVVESMIPERRRDEALLVGQRLNQAIGGYFRGQLAVAAIVGTMASIGLAILGLDFWLVVGMTAGVFNMVPMIGPWIGAIPGVVVALTTSDLRTALWVVAIMAGVQQIDNHFISPVVMKRAVKLHPAAVMLALLAGGTLGGFLGLLLAVPITAVLKIIVGHLWRTYVLGQPLEVERLAFAAEDAQPGGPVEDVDERSEALDRIAYPLESDTDSQATTAADDAADDTDDPSKDATRR